MLKWGGWGQLFLLKSLKISNMPRKLRLNWAERVLINFTCNSFTYVVSLTGVQMQKQYGINVLRPSNRPP